MVGLAVVVIGLDLALRRKGIVIAVGLVGLLVPLVLAVNLWNDVHTFGVDSAFGGALIVDKFAHVARGSMPISFVFIVTVPTQLS